MFGSEARQEQLCGGAGVCHVWDPCDITSKPTCRTVCLSTHFISEEFTDAVETLSFDKS